MTGRYFRKVRAAAFAVGAIIVVLMLTIPVSAAPSLTVSGAKLVATMSPGTTFVHKITVSIGSEQQPTDITLLISPFAQFIDGTPRISQDADNYSASNFITIDNSSFRLAPGGSELVNATIRLPKDVGDGGRYAIISVATRPPEDGKPGVIAEVDVPIYITVKGSHLFRQGVITNQVTGVSPGQPIKVVATFKNTGNLDFKVKNTITLNDSQGRTVAHTDVGLSLWTIIPGMSREISAALSPEVELLPGFYRLISHVTLDDGTLLDEKDTDFQLTTALSPKELPPVSQKAPIPPTPSRESLINLLAHHAPGTPGWFLALVDLSSLAVVLVIAVTTVIVMIVIAGRSAFLRSNRSK